MTSAENNRRPNYRRRILWLGVFVAVLVGAYSAGWFWLADQIVSRTRVAIDSVNRDGVAAECANPEARGFPFRIGLFCDRVAFADAAAGFSFSASRFRSAGQIYDPMRLVSELDGPASIRAGNAGALIVDWDLLRASARLAQPLPSRLSVEGRNLSAKTLGGAAVFETQTFEGHMRPNGADLDLAASFQNLRIDSDLLGGRELPPLSGRSDIVLADGVAGVVGREASLRGRSGSIRSLEIASGDAAVMLSGPFAVDDDGLVDADLRIELQDPTALQALLAKAFPEAGDKISASMSGLAALGNRPAFPLKIVKGKASLGFIPLGEVPPL